MQTNVRDYSYDQLQTIKGFFTESEQENIYASMDDYIHYQNDDATDDELIGGTSVEDRVNSITRKIQGLPDQNQGLIPQFFLLFTLLILT